MSSPDDVDEGLGDWTEAHALDWGSLQGAYRDHVNPGFHKVLRALGHDRVRLSSASGMYYRDSEGRQILDFFGGFGSLNVGHNHPRLAEVRRVFDETEQVEIAHAFIPTHATLLAKNLASLLPGDLDVTHFCCSGSEAMEAAIKLAARHARNPAGRIVHANLSMHGKTHGAGSITGWPPYQAPFKKIPGCEAVPFGDAEAIAQLFDGHPRPGDPGAVIACVLEPVQSGAGVVLPPPGYLREVARLCRQNGALLILDEVQTGLGRTGAMFAFEHEGVVPDAIALSKSLGGGKVPIGALVARRPVFERAFGGADDSTLLANTFGGMGGSCAVANETLRIILEERLPQNAAAVGGHLLRSLEELARKHPRLVSEVRGRGLLIGIEFRDLLDVISNTPLLRKAHKLARGALVALVAGSLLVDHGILVAFTEFNRNVMRLEPPLIVSTQQADAFCRALDETLSRGIPGLLRDTLETRLDVRSGKTGRGRRSPRGVGQ